MLENMLLFCPAVWLKLNSTQTQIVTESSEFKQVEYLIKLNCI